ncbi:MAG TPA: type II secretion system protein GspG [Verrucomicrobiae bacterium]|nr:type II secretion system protein GspG [Verrucomicrobiae bacterium]
MTLISKLRVIIYICGVVILLACSLRLIGWYLGSKELEDIKPWVTYGRLMYIAPRCDLYKAQNGVWPDSLAQLLVAHPELKDWIEDGWGHDVVLVPYNQTLGYGLIISYGRDGKPGGTGADRDIEVRFPTEANAAWNKEQGLGLKGPHGRP